jgi:hypothetical protein
MTLKCASGAPACSYLFVYMLKFMVWLHEKDAWYECMHEQVYCEAKVISSMDT